MAKLGRSLPRSAAIVPIGDQSRLEPRAALEALHAGGHELILCEGGPSLFGAFVQAGLVSELFLTLSPTLTGRPRGERRLSLLENGAPPRQMLGTLLSLRRSDSHLFLRYALPHGRVRSPREAPHVEGH